MPSSTSRRETSSPIAKVRSGEVLNMVVNALGVTGILTAAVICPNVLQLIPKSYRRHYSSHAIRQAIHRLDKKGWLILRPAKNGWRVCLTAKGRTELLAYELGQKHLHRKTRWDQKWRLLIFDVPEAKRWIRDRLRSTLITLGFVRLQDSIWIFPYECKEVLELLRTKYQIRHQALYLTAEAFDHDRWLRKEFKLPKKS